MEYYLLSEQDVKEICWELEIFLYEMKEVLRSKKIKKDEDEERD